VGGDIVKPCKSTVGKNLEKGGENEAGRKGIKMGIGIPGVITKSKKLGDKGDRSLNQIRKLPLIA